MRRLPVNNLLLENTPFPPHKKRCWKTRLSAQAAPYTPPCSAIFFHWKTCAGEGEQSMNDKQRFRQIHY